MNLESYFKRIIIYKSLMLVLIIIWGGMVQMSNTSINESNNITGLGGLLFAVFSVAYFFVSYQLYKFKPLGKRLFTPLVLLFIVLGFLSEFINPMEVDKNLYYLFVFYIVSPIFFVAQGVLVGMLYFSRLQPKFEKT
jgi:hypothetical protein